MSHAKIIVIKSVDDIPQRELLDTAEVSDRERHADVVLIERPDGTMWCAKYRNGALPDVEVIQQHDDHVRTANRPRPIPHPIVATAMHGATDTVVPQW